MITTLPYTNIMAREQLEYGLVSYNAEKNLFVCPWGSLLQDRVIHKTIFPTGKFDATFSRVTWDKREVTQKIIDLNPSCVFNCNSTRARLPFKQIPYIDYAKPSIEVADKHIDFSFIGWECNLVRRKIFDLYPNHKFCLKRDRYHYHHDEELRGVYSKTYDNILGRSRFSLCPRGVGSSTMRFWESLKCGAIPVLISDELNLVPWDWENTIIRISEFELFSTPNVIESKISEITTEKEAVMRDNCIKCYNYYNNLDNLFAYISVNLLD